MEQNEKYELDKSLIDEPIVSLIVPMYNVREDVAECIESIINQTLTDIQVILIDDGSTDDTGDIASAYAEQYPNIEYHRIPNQGLGHARNYGVQFARGKWLMFPDSDDVLNDFALYELVNLAEKHDCDIVMGDVVRFNTKKTFDSELHRKAFRDMEEVTHITKNHDLINDTTAWNKLYRRSFYQREDFKWVEGRLYEDIPVTIPAHFKANKVAFLDKVIYNWRVRDGQGASITQKRTEIKNFRDRFYAVKAVDAFFKENVTDDDLIVEKDYKWLSTDLMLFVNVLDIADESFQEEVVAEISEYLKGVRPEAFARLRAIDRIKYKFVQNNDIPQLHKALEYQKRAMGTLRLVRKGDRIIGRFPFKGLSDEECDMTNEIKESGLKTRVRAVTFGDNDVTVYCLVVIKPLSQKKVTLKARLVGTNTGETADLIVEGLPAPRKWEVRNNQKFGTIVARRQPLRHFNIIIPNEALEGLQEDSYRIELDYRDGELHCDPFLLRSPIVGAAPRPEPSLVGEKLVTVSYNANWQLVFNVFDNQRHVIDAALVDDQTMRITCADGTTSDIDLSVASEDNKVVDSKVPTVVPEPVFVPYPADADKVWRVSSNMESECVISLEPNGATTCKIENMPSGTGVRLTIDTSRVPSSQVKSLIMTGNRYGASSEVALSKSEADNDQMIAEIDFAKDDVTRLLRNDTYVLSILCLDDNGDEVLHTLYSPFSGSHDLGKFEIEGYRYLFDCYSGLYRVRVKRQRRIYEGRLRDQIGERVIYPLMRRLPIKKNLVVFESYWGRSVGCNPKALYDYIDAEHPEYECVWSVTDPRIPLEGNGKKVIRMKLPYYYMLARAKYLVNNVNFPDAYEKRKGQIEIQTMHGTPLKTLGLDVKSDFPTEESIVSFKRRCARWDYLIVQSPRVEEITKSCYLFDRTFLRTGYPRNDELFRKSDKEHQRQLKEKLGVDPDTKLVLYAPTWRVSGRFDLELDFARLSEALGPDYTFALRRHHLALPGFTKAELMGDALDFTFEKSIDDLLLAADIVITDYSSLMFDYAILDRPMLFFAYDLEQYRDNLRGFNIDLEKEAPGPILKTTDEVIEAIKACGDGLGEYKEMHERFKRAFLPYETGHASEGVFKQVFK